MKYGCCKPLCIQQKLWEQGVKTRVVSHVHINGPAIVGLAADVFVRAGVNAPTLERAAVLGAHAGIVIALSDHLESAQTDRREVVVRISPGGFTVNRLLATAMIVQVNERADFLIQEPHVGRIVVVGGIETDIPDGKLWVSGHELVEGDDASDRIMPGSGSHTKVNREVHGNIGIVNTEHV